MLRPAGNTPTCRQRSSPPADAASAPNHALSTISGPRVGGPSGSRHGVFPCGGCGYEDAGVRRCGGAQAVSRAASRCAGGVVQVAFPVAGGLLGEVGLHGGREVHARLVGQADEHPQHVGHLVGEVRVLARLERLVAVAAGHHAGQLPHLFREAGHVRQFRKVAHAVFVNPGVDAPLQFLEFHDAENLRQVTKKSLVFSLPPPLLCAVTAVLPRCWLRRPS